MSILKTRAIRSDALRKAAHGERCTLQLPGCNNDPATTVMAHLPDESHGMGRKPDDLSVCMACSACHDAIDGRYRSHECGIEIREDGERIMRRAQTRTLRRLVEQGVVTITGYTP